MWPKRKCSATRFSSAHWNTCTRVPAGPRARERARAALDGRGGAGPAPYRHLAGVAAERAPKVEVPGRTVTRAEEPRGRVHGGQAVERAAGLTKENGTKHRPVEVVKSSGVVVLLHRVQVPEVGCARRRIRRREEPREAGIHVQRWCCCLQLGGVVLDKAREL